MELFGLKKRNLELLEKADNRLATAEREHRKLTHSENLEHESELREYSKNVENIAKMEGQNSIRRMTVNGQLITESQHRVPSGFSRQKTFSAEYPDALLTMLRTKGQEKGAALAEGFDGSEGYLLAGPRMKATMEESTTTLGGFAVPSIVEPQIVPLATPPMAVRQLAMVIPTSSDIKVPRKTAHGTAATKVEASGQFAGTDPTIDQFTLSAFMLGHITDASWELLQDVASFQAFVVDDLLISIAELEEGYFVSGSGSGQPQGLLGNVGAGVSGEVADGAGNLLSIQSTFDVMGTLNPVYSKNASWLMTVASGIELRKAQMQSNLFAPVFVTIDGQDYLHGKPVYYSAAMPAIAAGATPVLYGDFKAGYVIGDRGGSGIYVKVLDQTKAVFGLVELLGYRRTDGRVRRSEAIQGITLHT